MRFGGTLLMVAALVAGGTIADARILGGGPAKADCYLYFDGIDATKGKFTVECTDNQPCDTDPAPGKCKFSFMACTGASDVSGCTPANVTSVKGKGLSTPVPTGGPACVSEELSIALKKSKKTNKRALKLTAKADGKPSRDLDTLILKCVASPSGAFVFE